MVVTRGGRALAAVGAPGGRRIIHAVVQVVLNLIERRMGAQEAVDAPRIDASGSTLLASERLADVAAQLRERGLPVALVSEEHEPFGYEMARPVLALRDAECSAAIDPFSRGVSAAI
jgi:gamma-glutamyltranspeptidase/glutathione hydrolase